MKTPRGKSVTHSHPAELDSLYSAPLVHRSEVASAGLSSRKELGYLGAKPPWKPPALAGSPATGPPEMAHARGEGEESSAGRGLTVRAPAGGPVTVSALPTVDGPCSSWRLQENSYLPQPEDLRLKKGRGAFHSTRAL